MRSALHKILNINIDFNIIYMHMQLYMLLTLI